MNAPIVSGMRLLLCVAFCALNVEAHAANLTNGPYTTENDASCDIVVAPAATLLLPYFEVSENRIGETTLFTITNVTNLAQIARVTLWTDFAYPVITFDVYLTGYDVQSINLYDVIFRGVIAGERGTGTWVSPEGEHAAQNQRLQTGNCGVVPSRIEPSVLARMQDAFLEGRVPGCATVGSPHENAVGYATIDVVRNCVAGRNPTDPRYFTEDILFDNVLLGDYLQVNRSQNFAQANPMVHIRAIPEGGTPRSRRSLTAPGQRLPHTFYGRFQPSTDRTADGRQPLPSTFAVRWISRGAGDLQTSLKIWREGVTGANARCIAYGANGFIELSDIVAFDEDENGEGQTPTGCTINYCFRPAYIPSVMLASLYDEDIFPMAVFREVTSGWIYLNLGSGYRDNVAAQNWVVATMRSESRFSVDLTAAALGNGCSPTPPLTDYSGGARNAFPAPAEDVNP
ncbi:MAG TPA: hypothetical protein VE010_01625 [Thermoanaerobaculia bacterium]|nr:hypothetical protein [Thermoanaerobaculia bacterium]